MLSARRWPDGAPDHQGGNQPRRCSLGPNRASAGVARRLLEILAVAGQPLGRTEACRAAGLGTDDRTALNVLRSGRLARGMGPGERDAIETYHDRIRETIVGHLAPALLSKHHLTLAWPWKPRARLIPRFWRFTSGAQVVPSGRGITSLRRRPMRLTHLPSIVPPSCTDPPLSLAGRQPPTPRPLQTRLGDALANAGRGALASRNIWRPPRERRLPRRSSSGGVRRCNC